MFWFSRSHIVHLQALSAILAFGMAGETPENNGTSLKITSGGPGEYISHLILSSSGPFYSSYALLILDTWTPERTRKASRFLAKEFEDDPVIRYMLCAFKSEEKRIQYLPYYFDILIKAAALNHGIFDEANDWSACAVWMPPGCRIDNALTLLPAGFISLLWNCGAQGCSVCSAHLNLHSFVVYDSIMVFEGSLAYQRPVLL